MRRTPITLVSNSACAWLMLVSSTAPTRLTPALLIRTSIGQRGCAPHQRGFSRSLIADIKWHELDARERTRRRGRAGAAEDPVAVAAMSSRSSANAGRCAGDQDNTPRPFVM